MIWSDLQALCLAHSTYVIASHQGPDGDCIGSELALHWYLTSLGKHARIVNSGPIPDKFKFLDPHGLVEQSDVPPVADVLVICDSSNLSRQGWAALDPAAYKAIINIDHHRDNSLFGTVNYVDGDVAATGVLLCRFFTGIKVEFPPAIAAVLYTAIMTDTGAFRFSNTTAEVLEICADLIRRGAQSAELYKQVYASWSAAGVLLKARIWSSMQFYSNNRVCSVEYPLDLIKALGATYGDAEGMADCTVLATSVQVGILIKYQPAETHFSLRSNGTVDVGQIAALMVPGGGGHRNAAGCTLKIPLEEAKARLLSLIEQELGAV